MNYVTQRRHVESFGVQCVGSANHEMVRNVIRQQQSSHLNTKFDLVIEASSTEEIMHIVEQQRVGAIQERLTIPIATYHDNEELRTTLQPLVSDMGEPAKDECFLLLNVCGWMNPCCAYHSINDGMKTPRNHTGDKKRHTI